MSTSREQVLLLHVKRLRGERDHWHDQHAAFVSEFREIVARAAIGQKAVEARTAIDETLEYLDDPYRDYPFGLVETNSVPLRDLLTAIDAEQQSCAAQNPKGSDAAEKEAGP